MSKDPQQRPGQATLAGGLIIGGSIVVVLTAWQRIATLHTIEAQERLQQAVSQPAFDGLGMSLDTLSTVVRVLCLVAAGAATAATILGFQVFKRSTSARIALTVLAPLLLIGGFATEGFFAPMVVAGITLLWLQPTRDWYAGRPWRQRYEQRRSDRIAALRSPGQAATPPSPTGPTAPPVAPTEPGLQGEHGVPAHAPQGSPASEAPDGAGIRERRPPGLVLACVMTWVTSSLVILSLVATAVVASIQRDELMVEIEKQQGELVETYGLTETDLLAAVYLMVGGLVLWAIAAIVLAYLTFRRHNWARITLAVSSAVAGVTALAMSIGNPALILLVAILAISTWLLLRADVAAWFRR
jgi:hypothetical protein